MTTAAQKVISPVNVEERKNLDIRAGDTVRVWQKIQEKERVRLQAFEGIVLAVKHGREPGATFTVRRVVDGVGVERIFPIYSPAIDKIEILKRAKVRRAKLYYIREKAARQIRRQMRRLVNVDISTESDIEVKARAEEEAKRAEEEAQKAEEEKANAEEEKPSEASEENAVNDESDKEEPTNFEEKMDDASVEEVKEQIKQDDPEENPIKAAEKEIKEKKEEKEE